MDFLIGLRPWANRKEDNYHALFLIGGQSRFCSAKTFVYVAELDFEHVEIV